MFSLIEESLTWISTPYFWKSKKKDSYAAINLCPQHPPPPHSRAFAQLVLPGAGAFDLSFTPGPGFCNLCGVLNYSFTLSTAMKMKKFTQYWHFGQRSMKIVQISAKYSKMLTFYY